jgi:hypothetical protein
MRTGVLAGAVACLAFALGGEQLQGGSGAKAQQERIAGLIKQLRDNQYARREAASRELAGIGEPALPALRQAAVGEDPEARRRAEQIVRTITARLFVVAANKELARWQGEWEESRGTVLWIKGDRWSWGMKGAKPTYQSSLQIVALQERMVLVDLLVNDDGHPRKGQTTKAIFHLDGDTLLYSGSYDQPRATAFIKGSHDPYYVEWKRRKK